MKILALAVIVSAILLGACSTGSSSTDEALRSTILKQIDDYEAKYGAQGAARAVDQQEFLNLNPELQRYHAWYFAQETEQAKGPLNTQVSMRTPPAFLREKGALDRYLKSVK